MEDGPSAPAHLVLGDHLNDLVATFDASGRCRYLNRSGRRLLRLPATGDPGLHLSDLAATEDADRLVEVLEAIRRGETWSGSLALRSPIAGDLPTRSVLCPVVLDDDEPGIGWVARDTTTDREVIRALRERTFYDPVTGLSHRSLFLDRLDLLLRHRDGTHDPVAVLFVLPDRFRERMTHFATGAADRVLREIATRLAAVLGDAGDRTVHRWSDEDFVVLCSHVPDESEARLLAAAIAACFAEPFPVEERALYLTASIGVAVAAAGRARSEDLLRQADAAAQLARGSGGATIRTFDQELRDRALRHADLEARLRGAARRGELVLHFQPEIELRTNRIVACEALLRWRHPDLGLVPPAEFVPVAEASSLILEVGDWVLRTALAQTATWAAMGHPVTVGVNISGRQFQADDFEVRVAHALAETAVDPDLVCLEITESVLLDDAEDTIAKLGRLKALGLHLAIDDFGTGYSSLSYLRRFPVDILKVDKSFVAGLGHDPGDSAIVQAVVHMGRALRLTTVAEGVETPHHVIELRELDCDIAQGYHFARPAPAEVLTALLVAGDGWMSDARD